MTAVFHGDEVNSVGIVVAAEGPEGSIRREAVAAGNPAINYEAGPPYGFLEPEIAPVVRLGDTVEPGQLLVTVTDPITDQANEIRATEAGIVIGMALPQVVLSGFALVHVGEVK